MNKIFVRGSLFFILAALVGCQKVEVPYPEVPAAVYFSSISKLPNDPNSTETFNYSGTARAMVKTVEIKLTGDASDQPRRIMMEQVFESLPKPNGDVPDVYENAKERMAVPLRSGVDLLMTKAYIDVRFNILLAEAEAVAGGPLTQEEADALRERVESEAVEAHYVAFDHVDYEKFLKAYNIYGIGKDVKPVDNATDLDWDVGIYTLSGNTDHIYFPVILIRDPSLAEVTVETSKELHFRLVDNDNFITGPNNMIEWYIRVNDVTSEPKAWKNSPTGSPADRWIEMFGHWNVTKQNIITDATGWTDWELERLNFPRGSQRRDMRTRFETRLAEMRNRAPGGVVYDTSTQEPVYTRDEEVAMGLLTPQNSI